MRGSGQFRERNTSAYTSRFKHRVRKCLREIIDAHTHLSERSDDALNRFARKNGLRYTLDELLGTMRRYKIVRGLLLSPPLQGGAPLPNDKVIRLCIRSGGMPAPVVTAKQSRSQVKAP